MINTWDEVLSCIAKADLQPRFRDLNDDHFDYEPGYLYCVGEVSNSDYPSEAVAASRDQSQPGVLEEEKLDLYKLVVPVLQGFTFIGRASDPHPLELDEATAEECVDADGRLFGVDMEVPTAGVVVFERDGLVAESLRTLSLSLSKESLDGLTGHRVEELLRGSESWRGLKKLTLPSAQIILAKDIKAVVKSDPDGSSLEVFLLDGGPLRTPPTYKLSCRKAGSAVIPGFQVSVWRRLSAALTFHASSFSRVVMQDSRKGVEANWSTGYRTTIQSS
ncbi:hypothetical protein L218DRAFT_951194 [Marasmius fiardii PR-910]|nr:hypothetical protein L218DRAFT_951194 [Marasmius fiardii PR-910]